MVLTYGNAEVRQNMRSRESIPPTAGAPKSSRSTNIWLRVIYTFALTVLAGTLVACGAGLVGQGGPKIARDQTKITGKALLVGNQSEATGYGLYSYVLFESEPTAETKPVYIAVILACLKEYPDLEGLAKKYHPQSLNAMYIPVIADIADPSKVPSLEQSEHARLKPRAEEILQGYNYGRAQAILDQLSNVQRSGGPYLVSSLVPASSRNGTSSFLFQDLSAVRLVSSLEDQKKIAYEWVLDFVDRVSNPQPQAWDRASLATFSDEVREARQPAFQRYGVRADQLDLKKYIVFPIPDTNAQRTFPIPSWRAEADNGGPHVRNALDQSRSVPQRVSFPRQPVPMRQKVEACDGRCLVHE